jgi:hypothetical protein
MSLQRSRILLAWVFCGAALALATLARVQSHDVVSYFNQRDRIEDMQLFRLPFGPVVHNEFVVDRDRLAVGPLFFESPTGAWERGTFALIVRHEKGTAELPIHLEESEQHDPDIAKTNFRNRLPVTRVWSVALPGAPKGRDSRESHRRPVTASSSRVRAGFADACGGSVRKRESRSAGTRYLRLRLAAA